MEIKNTIKAQEYRLKNSNNLMEQRHIRANIAQLYRDIKLYENQNQKK